MTQSIQGVRTALLTACRALYEDMRDTKGAKVLVSNGPPGVNIPGYVVMVGKNVGQRITRPTMGAGRSREREVSVTVTVSALVPGAAVAGQQKAIEAHDEMVDRFETWLRHAPNEELGGACRDSWLSEIDGPVLDVTKQKNGTITGRLAESVLTVTVYIRY